MAEDCKRNPVKTFYDNMAQKRRTYKRELRRDLS